MDGRQKIFLTASGINRFITGTVDYPTREEPQKEKQLRYTELQSVMHNDSYNTIKMNKYIIEGPGTFLLEECT